MRDRRSNLTPAYTWNERSQRYRNTATGRFVPRQQVRQALDIALDRSRNEVARLSRELVNGRINLADWQTSIAREVKSMHMCSAALAKGGWAQMTPQDTGRAGRLIRDEYGWLAKCAAQVKSGEQPLNGDFLRRVDQYAYAPRHTYHFFEEKEMLGTGKTEYKNVLGPADHCDGPGSCLEQDRKGWQPIGTLIQIGERRCLRRCKCSFVYR